MTSHLRCKSKNNKPVNMLEIQEKNFCNGSNTSQNKSGAILYVSA